MTKNFWEQYDRAFNNTRVQGYALLKNGEPIGSVAIKYPRDGAGRLQAFVWICDGDTVITEKGWAGGYGYDKTSAAVASALGGTRFDLGAYGGADWKDALKEKHGVTAFATIRR